jgi:hypothetical protein
MVSFPGPAVISGTIVFVVVRTKSGERIIRPQKLVSFANENVLWPQFPEWGFFSLIKYARITNYPVDGYHEYNALQRL